MTYMEPVRLFILCAVIFATVFFAGCIISGSSVPPPDLTGREWTLVSYRGPAGEQVPVVPGAPFTLSFDAAGGFRGRSGCNSYQGTYTVEGELITIQSLNVTAVSCVGPGVPDEATGFLALLRNTTRYHVADDHLILSYYDMEKLMVLQSGG